MFKKKGLAGLMIGLCLVAVFFLANYAQAGNKPIKLVFSSYLKKAFPNNLTCKFWMDEVSRRTNGRVEFTTYYNGTLLKGAESLPGCGRGMCDLTLCPDAYTADRHPLSMVQSLLFMTDKMDSYLRACYKLFTTEPLLIKEFTKNNVHFLVEIPVSSNILGAREKIDSLALLKHKRIRAMAMTADALSILGATPVGLSLGEVYDGLDKGVIDGYSLTDFTLACMFHLYEAAPYMIDTGMGQFGGMFFVMNKRKWDKLPSDIKKVMTEVAKEAIDKHVGLYEKIEGQMVDRAHKGGAKVVILTDEEKARWRQTAGPKLWEKWVSDKKAKGLKGAYIFNKWKELINKENKRSTYKSAYQVFAGRYGAEH
ncbi:MAG: TRAP transporter substrate-binding protein DctP [Deltaproteobacteria bacterium]|nr:TRAP transporter substrate-binding protein DctP [Deltaproteobacteria bacterium]MBW1931493.1 TRAP transporter substrate-binding protein DctP [Deltaproteobacteria bacterium]MBW1978554.1 TRAP transporter substrate-binding protein DctP [Deltaproteobacteria bacterium]MBW2044868.1 TRAP transporter substrate-binding protein DctP [Deltaproteobacteria bacterium]